MRKSTSFVSLAPVAISLLPSLASHLSAQLQWNVITRVPQNRSMHAMAFDAARQRMVVFGGIGTNWLEIFDDTWEWDGSTWANRSSGRRPSPRAWTDMVYDARRQRIVLFGGMTAQVAYGDTWEFDGTRWTEVTPASNNPEPRAGHALAYDAARGRIVLFGGRDAAGHPFGDTWEWDGSSWQRVSTTGPLARVFPGMRYDPGRQRTVLFGGGDDSARKFYEDTWEWDGNSWVDRTPNAPGPTPRLSAAMAYDPQLRRVVFFGGLGARYVVRGDAWAWDGNVWLRVEASGASPRARWQSRLGYDSTRNRMVLIGGNGYTTGSVGNCAEYQLRTVTSSVSAYGQGCGGIALRGAPGTRPAIGEVFTLEATNVPSPFGAILTAGARRTAPQSLDAIGMAGCFLHHSLDAAWLVIVQNRQAQFSMPVPWRLPLAGQKVFFQVAADRVSSNALEVLVGIR